MPSPTTVLLRTQTDERLVVLAREGHERAFEAIVERYRRPLLRAARRVLPESRAEDALQHALLSAWKGLQRGDEVRDLRAWLYRIVHNTALNQLRTSGYDYELLQESLRVADGPEHELERRAVVRQTLAGLAQLPTRQREALLRIAVEGRSQEEVARDLGLSHGAVRQLVHRARTALRATATAVVPLPLVTWVASAAARGEPLTNRIGELTAGAGGAGASAALAKTGVVVVLAGGAVGGPALVERQRDRADVPRKPAGERHRAVATPAAAPAAAAAEATLVSHGRSGSGTPAGRSATPAPLRRRAAGSGPGGSGGRQEHGSLGGGDDSGERRAGSRDRDDGARERRGDRSGEGSGGGGSGTDADRDEPERDDRAASGSGESGGDDAAVRTPASGESPGDDLTDDELPAEVPDVTSGEGPGTPDGEPLQADDHD